MNSLNSKLEELLPELRQIAAQIKQEIPDINVRVYERTNYPNYEAYIDCIFTKDYFTEVDDVALCVSINPSNSAFKIKAYVCWGYPSAYIEAEFSGYVKSSINNSLIIKDEVLEDFHKNLPRLYEVLFEALRRRKPPNE